MAKPYDQKILRLYLESGKWYPASREGVGRTKVRVPGPSQASVFNTRVLSQ